MCLCMRCACVDVRARVYVRAWAPLSAHGVARTWKITISQHNWESQAYPSITSSCLRDNRAWAAQAAACGSIPQRCRGWRAVHSARHLPLPSAWEPPFAHRSSTLSKKHVPAPAPGHSLSGQNQEMETETKVPPCQQGPELPLPARISSPEPVARGAGRSNCPLVRSHRKLRLVGGCFPHSVGWKADRAAAGREKKEAGGAGRFSKHTALPGLGPLLLPTSHLPSSCKPRPGSPPQ